MRKKSYTSNIKIGYILIILLMLLSLSYSIYSGEQQKNTDRFLSTNSLPVIKLAGELQRIIANEQVLLSKYFFSRHSIQIYALTNNEASFEKHLLNIKKLSLSQQEKQYVELIEKEYFEAKNLTSSIIQSVENLKATLTTAEMEQNYSRSLIRLTQVHSFANKLANIAYEKYEARRLQSLTSLNFSLTLNIISSIILLVFALLFFRFMNKFLNILEVKGTKDGLTQLFNKSMLEEFLKVMVDKSRRGKSCLTLMVLDIDFFKKINDTYGHLAGDYILKEIASIIKSSVRLSDFPARFGGEEFAVVLPDTSLENCIKVAERIRASVESASFFYENHAISVTISIGIALWQNNYDTGILFEKADEKLYEAKESGRNRVCY